jgi:hypothetical protein
LQNSACGGGGDSGSASNQTPAASYTYFQQGGLTWSSTSAQTYRYVPLGSSIPLDQSNGYFCNGSTNGVIDNFNKQTGWRLPTQIELQNLYKEMPRPPGFVIGRVWMDNNGAIDFATGGIVIGGNTDESKFYVTCVRKT